MAVDDEPDDDADDPLGAARPVLTAAVRLGTRAVEAGDPSGAYELFACATRLARKVRGLGEVADFRLERALDDAEAEDEPQAQAESLRDSLEHILGDDEPEPRVPDEPLAAIQLFIEMAISIGAPAYNTGDQQGCFDVYSCTARMILTTVSGAEEAKTRLREALDRCTSLDSPNDQAWTMRHAFDSVAEMGPGGEDVAPREVKLYLSLAIQIGAPAFNLGDRRGCYEVYCCTARLLANTAAVPDAVKGVLRAALEEASTIPDVNRQAWIMRHAFDSLLAGNAEPEETKG